MGFSLKDIPSNSGPPDGTYQFKFTKVEAAVSQKGKPKIQLDAVIMSGEYMNKKIVYSWSLDPAALWRVKDNLIGCGLDESYEFSSDPLSDPRGFTNDVKGILMGGKIWDVKAETKTQKTGEYAGRTNTDYTILGKAGFGGATSDFDSV